MFLKQFYLCLSLPSGKILIIGGSIANFTNVAATFKVGDCSEVAADAPSQQPQAVLSRLVWCWWRIFSSSCWDDGEDTVNARPPSSPVPYVCFCFLQGIVRAIKDYQGPLKEHEVRIFVRRGGPNYQEGLRVMGEVGKDHPFPSLQLGSCLLYLPPASCWAVSRLNTSLWQKLVLFLPLRPQSWLFLCAHAGKTTGIPIHVFGTETHMTAIVGMALGHRPIPNQPPAAAHTANFLLNASGSPSVSSSTPLCERERWWEASWRQLSPAWTGQSRP